MPRANLKAAPEPKPATLATIRREAAETAKEIYKCALDGHTQDDARRIVLETAAIVLRAHAITDEKEPLKFVPPRHLTLEAARTLAYEAHCLAASAFAWKLGVDALGEEDNIIPADPDSADASGSSVENAAQSSLDALARQAAHVLKSVREFHEHDAAGD